MTQVDAAIETYELMSQKYFTHATPTLFNAGTPRPQLSSCFLLAMKEDSIEGIYDTLKRFADSASISQLQHHEHGVVVVSRHRGAIDAAVSRSHRHAGARASASTRAALD